MHETNRIFSDRLINLEDVKVYKQMQQKIMSNCLGLAASEDIFKKEMLLWGNYLKGGSIKERL